MVRLPGWPVQSWVCGLSNWTTHPRKTSLQYMAEAGARQTERISALSSRHPTRQTAADEARRDLGATSVFGRQVLVIIFCTAAIWSIRLVRHDGHIVWV